jgi:predicted ferric reductase
MRALLWCGLYALLALAPLTVAAACDPLAVARPWQVEFAVALGFAAFALIAIEFALVSRIHAMSAPFGNDALMLFHRKMGIAALLLACAHPLLLVGHGVGAASWIPWGGSAARCTGAIALWALVALIATTVARRRTRLNYEIWQRLHRWLALLVTGAMLGHVLAIGEYSRAPAVRAVSIGYVALFVALLLYYRVVRPLSEWRRPWEVVSNRDEGADTRTLVLRPVGHAGIEFEPGQFVWITLGATPFGAEEHPISIASSAERHAGHEIELSIKALGDWSRNSVPALPVGSRAWLDGPFGAFSLDRAAAQGFVMIAGGIGITPMRSMLLSMRERGDRRPVVLFYAARNRSRAPFAAEFERLATEIDLRLVFVFEEPREPAPEHGYVTLDVLRRHVPGDLRRLEFFVCGPPAMMDALERELAELGVDPRHVQTERFDMV